MKGVLRLVLLIIGFLVNLFVNWKLIHFTLSEIETLREAAEQSDPDPVFFIVAGKLKLMMFMAVLAILIPAIIVGKKITGWQSTCFSILIVLSIATMIHIFFRPFITEIITSF